LAAEHKIAQHSDAAKQMTKDALKRLRGIPGQCPVCESKMSHPIFKKGIFLHLMCNECQGVFIEPYPRYTLGNYSDPAQREAPHCPSADFIVSKMIGVFRRAPRRTEILEVGCASGGVLLHLGALLFDCTGIDISVECIDAAQEAIHRAEMSSCVRILPGVFPYLHQQIAAGDIHPPYDLVILIHLLEHIPDVETAWTILRDLGRSVIIWTPNALLGKEPDWIHFNHPTVGEHCVLYSPYGLKLRANEVGFDTLMDGVDGDDYWALLGNR
jgi:SAM-dependent methyltransferase